MAKYNHNQIEVDELIVGETYQYYEDGMVADIKLLEDNSDDEGIKLKIEFLINHAVFNVFAAHDAGSYYGMWKIYPPRTHKIILN